MRKNDERRNQGQINNKAKQYSTPKAVYEATVNWVVAGLTRSCADWYLRCSVFTSQSMAMYGDESPMAELSHLIGHPRQNL